MNKNNKKISPYIIASIIILGYLIICYFLILTKFPLWNDEIRFYRTAVSFSNDFSFKHILQYDELITPFSFLAYGLWGKVFGTDLQIMRTLSLVIGFITHISMFVLLNHFFKGKILWILFLTWLLNPYNVGLNALIFTDGFSNLWTILFIWVLIKNKPSIYLAILSILLLLTRQYNIIIILSALIYFSIAFLKSRNKTDIHYIISLLVGCIPLLILFILWKGFSPPGILSNKLDKVPFAIYPESIPVYIYCFFIYTLPMSIYYLFKINRRNLKMFVFLFVLTLGYYILFPVTPSGIAIEAKVYTVGLYDKFLVKIFPINIIRHIVLYISFLLGSILLIQFISIIRKQIQTRKITINYNIFFIIYISMFLIIMIVNFQIWEKYFLQLLPIALIMVGTLQPNYKDPNNKVNHI